MARSERVCKLPAMKSMIKTASVALILVAGPAWGQSWQDVRNYMLGPGRADLMTFCDQGRRLNSLGSSYWDHSRRERMDAERRAMGYSSAQIYSYNAGFAAAMSQVCPDVR
jgi:hypothetical protein